MEILKELVAILSSNKLEQIDLPGSSSSNLTSSLYNALRNGTVATDEQAAELLYNESSDSFRYKKLKNRVRTKLISSLFFIDVSKAYSLEIERAFHHCTKVFAATSILITKGARKTAIDLSEKYLPISMKFEFTYLSLSFCRNLCSHYGTIEKNEKKYNKYTTFLKQLMETMEAEIQVEIIYSKIASSLLNTKQSNSQESISEWEHYYKQVKNILYNHSTHTFLRNSYKIIFYYHLQNKDYNNMISSSEEAVTRLGLKPYETRNIQFSFHLNSIVGKLQLQQFDKAIDTLSIYSNKFNKGVYNWYVTQYYILIAFTHKEDYDAAFKIIKSVVQDSKFTSMPKGVQQNFLVHEAYMEFLNEAGLITCNNNNESKTFRIYKFLNQIPIYSKDKSGLNISILIVHVLFLLLQRKYSDIIDRVDALNQYCHRYLRNDETFRSNCFIKMLIQMSRADFNPIRTKRYTDKYYNKLTSKPLNIAEHGLEIEIIPYEKLWKIINSII